MLYKTCTTQAVMEVEASRGTPCNKKDPVTSWQANLAEKYSMTFLQHDISTGYLLALQDYVDQNPGGGSMTYTGAGAGQHFLFLIW